MVLTINTSLPVYMQDARVQTVTRASNGASIRRSLGIRASSSRFTPAASSRLRAGGRTARQRAHRVPGLLGQAGIGRQR